MNSKDFGNANPLPPSVAGNYITVAEDPTFEFRFTDPDTRKQAESVFVLREVPDDVESVIRQRHTTHEYHRGRKQEDLDAEKYSADILDYAIVEWREVRGIKGGQPFALECNAANKVRLPEKVKSEIIRVCLGKEAGTLMAKEAARAASDPTK